MTVPPISSSVIVCLSNFTKFGVRVAYAKFRASTNFAQIGLVTDIYRIGGVNEFLPAVPFFICRFEWSSTYKCPCKTAEYWRFLWKSLHWIPHFTYRREYFFSRVLYVFYSISTKFGIVFPHLFCDWAFHENRRCYNHALFAQFPHLLSDLDEIRCKRCANNAVERMRVSWKAPLERPCFSY
jgi:hypothetical protein